ncbi:MAG: hypothetical protein HYU70_13120 [Bacteroidetes bacterium]|nr:hypothetical protein [Bacteroidota bacterium]
MNEVKPYRLFFEQYMKSVFQTEIDIRFWKHFLSMSIDSYKKENPENRWINQSGFSAFNIPSGGSGWLHMRPETHEIKISDLNKHSDDFFLWIMDLAIVRVYNSIELLIQQSIQTTYFPSLSNPAQNKKNVNKLNREIRDYLKSKGINDDSTNNRHLINCIKCHSHDYGQFLNVKAIVNWNTNWGQFYELFSLLRNVVVHHGMMVTSDSINNIKSVAEDIFTHYFVTEEVEKDLSILKPKEDQLFLNFISQANDFAVNTVKYIADEPDLKFIGFYKA